MKYFRVNIHFPAGSVLIGGYAEVPDGLHGAHARDRAGRPILPATAIRGALRESLEAVLRGADMQACAGGTGLTAEAADSDGAKPIPCILHNGGRCIACRLFGTQRSAIDTDERRFSALVLEEGTSASNADVWTNQPGVSISRKRRSAEDKRLFLRSVPATSRTLHFSANGRLLDEQLKTYFDAAVRATTHLGSGRSRGYARVNLSLEWLESGQTAAAALPAEGDILLRVELKSPAALGVPIAGDGPRDTREEIPGSALRGAIGFALADALPDPKDAAFQALVAEDGAHFGFLYPVDDDTMHMSAPLPITSVACKYGRRKHGIVDTLLDRLAIAHIDQPGHVSSVEATSITSRCNAPSCGGPLRGIHGARRMGQTIPTRTVTRLAMDRSRSSARNGQLFMQTLLEPGAIFEGTIRNVPPISRDRLALALAQPLAVGRGRGNGWGQVKITASPLPPQQSLEDRGKAFDAALRRRLEQAGLATHRVGRLVPITLLSPLVPTTENDDGSAELQRLVEAAGCYLKARRFCREGGWDQRLGHMEPLHAVAAGGVFVLDFGEGRSWAQALDALATLEKRGVGQRRYQGYGHIRCFDEFIFTQMAMR